MAQMQHRDDPETIEQSDRADSSHGRWQQVRHGLASVSHAGLGILLSMQQRGRHAYRRLARKGALYQQQRRGVETQDDRGAERRSAAVEKIHDLEHRLEDRLDRGRDTTLHWIGVPSRKEFRELCEQVEQLRETVQLQEKQLRQFATIQASQAGDSKTKRRVSA